LHHRERWHDQAQALINGETVAKAAKRCKLAHTTAFRWGHRFLSALNLDKPQRLSGIVEADETFILESFKGKRSDLPRTARKRGGKAGKRGLSVEQIPVMVARDRNGATIDAVLPRLDAASITAAPGLRRGRPGQRHHPACGIVLRWRQRDHRLRAARPGQVPCVARPRHPKARGAAVSHQ
jgi:hypothetical protein